MAMTGGTPKHVATGYASYASYGTSYPIKLYVYYKTAQNVANNQSTITLGMYVTVASGASIGHWYGNTCYVGTTSMTFNGDVPSGTTGTRWLVENKTMTVNHNADGTGKATIYWKWGAVSSWANINAPSGSFSIDLPKINRSYTLTFNPNGGTLPNPGENLYMTTTNSAGHKNTGNSVTVTVNSGNYAGMTKDIPTKTGHSFKGWYTSTSGGAQVYNAAGNCTNEGTYWSGGVWKYNGNVTLYAQWTANNYTLTVNPNGGSWNSNTNSQSFTQAYGTTKTISNPTRTGHSFTNWSLSGYGSLSGTTYTYGAGAGTLTANWSINTYTVTYNANGGSGAPAAQTKIYGTALKLSLTIPTLSGYTFLGWSTSATSGVVNYNAGAKYENEASVTLYAVWSKTIAVITYNGNGSNVTNIPASEERQPGSTVIISNQIPVKDRHLFLGWGTTPNATVVQYAPGASAFVDNSITLYAIWRFNDKGLYIDSNGVINAVNYKIVNEVTELLDSKGCLYATAFIRHNEDCVYIDLNNDSIKARDFIGISEDLINQDSNYYFYVHDYLIENEILQFRVNQNMTWDEWLDSEWATEDFTRERTLVYYKDVNLQDEDGGDVYLEDIIQVSGIYKIY